MAELLDPPEEAVHVAGVLPQEAALQDEGVRGAAAVANLAVPTDPLVGVDADESGVEGGSPEAGDAQVGDLQARGAGGGADVGFRAQAGLLMGGTRLGG